MTADIERMAQEVIEAEEQAQGARKSASTLLVEIARDEFSFGVSTTGDTFAVPKSGPKIVKMLRGSKTSLRAGLARQFFTRYGKAASQQALADALMVIDGLAQEADESELHLRVCGSAGQDVIWLDMGDLTGRVITITKTGWSIEPEPPVLFKRTLLMSPLPDPIVGHDLDPLWSWINVEEVERPLLLAWLVSCLYEEMPHPILALSGEQGTGKTTAQKIIVSVLDPSPVPTRKPPRDADAWVTAAAGSWLVGLDNLSTVPDWLSDSLCRAVTGDGDVRRKLYTDGEHAVFAFRRCLCLNSIDLGAVRGDLAERMLPITLNIIPDDMRLTEAEIWPAWEQAHGQILGAVLTLASRVMAVLPSVELASKPRMADFARIVAGVDEVLGTDGLVQFLGKQASLAADSLDGDGFIAELAKLKSFQGTAAELLEKITPTTPPKGWPANPRAVTQRLRRQAPVMRKAGWQITDDRGANHDKVVRWSIARPEMSRISSPLDPHTRLINSKRGSAGNAGQEYGQSQDDEPLDHLQDFIDLVMQFGDERGAALTPERIHAELDDADVKELRTDSSIEDRRDWAELLARRLTYSGSSHETGQFQE